MKTCRFDLFNLSPRIILDGKVIRLRNAVAFARAQGFNGCDDTIKRRIRAGVSTLAELAKPVTPGQTASAERMRRRAAAERAAMAATVAALNERKAAMRSAE